MKPLMMGFFGVLLGTLATGIGGFILGIFKYEYQAVILSDCNPKEVFVDQPLICNDSSEYTDGRIWESENSNIGENKELQHSFSSSGDKQIILNILKSGEKIEPVTHLIKVLDKISIQPKSFEPIQIRASYVFPVTATQVELECTLDKTQDIHRGFNRTTRSYSELCKIPENSNYSSAKFVPTSVNNGSPVTLDYDASQNGVVARFSLTSGPSFDRWRGWAKGKIIVKYSTSSSRDPELIVAQEIDSDTKFFFPYVAAAESVTVVIRGTELNFKFGEVAKFGDFEMLATAEDSEAVLEIKKVTSP